MNALALLGASGLVSTVVGVSLAAVARTPPEPVSGAMLVVSALGVAAMLFAGMGVYLLAAAVAVGFNLRVGGVE